MKKQIEVELRASVDKTIFKKFKKTTNLLKNNSKEHDTYYRPLTPNQVDWVVRIRKKDNTYYLTFKSNQQFGEGAWNEVNILITKDLAKKMHDFFISNNFFIDAEVIKDRITYNQKNMEVNIDKIQGLGIFVEAEILVSEDKVAQAQTTIKSYFKSLGITEDSIIKKGYVTLMKERLNE